MSDDTRQAAGFLYSAAMNVWLAPSLWTAVQLKLADRVAKKPATAEVLASELGAHADTLSRLMNALTSVGVFSRTDDGRFGLTPISDVLRSDHPQSLAGLMDVALGGENQFAWLSLTECVRTGRSAFEIAHGTDWIEYYERNPDRGRIFAAAMTGTTRANEDAVLAAHDFGEFATVVDIGGSAASFIGRVLEKYPSARGIVFDLPTTVENARSLWANKPFAGRLSAVGGDFFKEVPAGDLYLLKNVIHDWPDAESISILKNIRRAMRPGGRVAIVETLVPDQPVPDLGWALDIAMMALTGGRERTVTQYTRLLEQAGFKFIRTTPTPSVYTVMEAQVA